MSVVSIEAVAADLEQFIRETFHVTADDALFTRQVHLYQEGYVDSVGVVNTISHLEQTWDITIPPTAVFDPLFTHIDGMARYVVGLREARERAAALPAAGPRGTGARSGDRPT